MQEVHSGLPYKDFDQPDASNLKTVTYCAVSGMLPGPACSGHLITGTFYIDDVPTGTCTVHKVQTPVEDPTDTEEPGETTDPGTGDGGETTDPGTGDGGATDPAQPPAEGGEETTGRRRRERPLAS